MHVSPEVLVALLSLNGTTRVKVTGMPADAEITGISDQVKFDCNLISFRVESSEFPEVPVGYAVEELRLEMSEVRDSQDVPFQIIGSY